MKPIELRNNLNKLGAWFRLNMDMAPEARVNCAEVCEAAAKELEIPHFHYKQCEIPDFEEEGLVQLWAVQGIEGAFYPTKMVAEQAARITFPKEPNNAYGRIHYSVFVREE